MPPEERNNIGLLFFAAGAAILIQVDYINEVRYRDNVAAFHKIADDVVCPESNSVLDIDSADKELMEDRNVSLDPQPADTPNSLVQILPDQDKKFVLVSGFLQSDEAATLDDEALQLREQGWISKDQPLLQIVRRMEMYQHKGVKSSSHQWDTEYVHKSKDLLVQRNEGTSNGNSGQDLLPQGGPSSNLQGESINLLNTLNENWDARTKPELLGVDITTCKDLYISALDPWGHTTRLSVSHSVFSENEKELQGFGKNGAESIFFNQLVKDQQIKSSTPNTEPTLRVSDYKDPFVIKTGQHYRRNLFMPVNQPTDREREGDLRMFLHCFPPQVFTILALQYHNHLIPGWIEWGYRKQLIIASSAKAKQSAHKVRMTYVLAGRHSKQSFFEKIQRNEYLTRCGLHVFVSFLMGGLWTITGNQSRLLQVNLSASWRTVVTAGSFLICPLTTFLRWNVEHLLWKETDSDDYEILMLNADKKKILAAEDKELEDLYFDEQFSNAFTKD